MSARSRWKLVGIIEVPDNPGTTVTAHSIDTIVNHPIEGFQCKTKYIAVKILRKLWHLWSFV